MSQTGFITLEHMGILAVEGPDARSFLQGQITCHMDKLSVTQASLAGYCDIKGRLQNVFEVIYHPTEDGDRYWLLMPKEMILLAISQFKKYALFSKVQFSDASAVFPMLGLIADNAPWMSLSIQECAVLPPESEQTIVLRIPGMPARFMIIPQSAERFSFWQEELIKQYPLLAKSDWLFADIHSLLPVIYPATVGTLLPHHANLLEHGGIGFDKGCYLGQEIIARMHYKGKIKKHLYRGYVSSAESPQPGDAIRSQDPSFTDATGSILEVAPHQDGYAFSFVIDDDMAQSPLTWQDSPITVLK